MKKLAAALVLLVALGIAGDRGYDWLQWQMHAPVATRSEPVTVTIPQGATSDQVADLLVARGLIRNKQVFLGYLRYRGGSTDIQAGALQLDRSMNLEQITMTLQEPRSANITIRLPEGYTLRMMGSQAQEAGLGTATGYGAATGNPAAYPYAFLRDRPASAPRNLEGYLFPDTYQVPRGSGDDELVRRQLQRFQQVVDAGLRQAAATPAPGRPAESFYTVLTLAPIVEREVGKDPDRAIVCGIFYNRLAANMPLGADATVLYAVGRWKGGVSQQDLAVDSPYNTRKVAGLPPGPISNPGVDAIKSCTYPQPSGYRYYFTDPRGMTHYSATDGDFQAQQRQYGVASQ
jgi:UPF0755 protein